MINVNAVASHLPSSKAATEAAPLVEHLAKRVDTNHDGKVTSAEHAAFAETMFNETDADHDGSVSAAECDSEQAKHGDKVDRAASAAHLRVVDTDGSGQISASENAAYAASNFARADKNGDGSLSEKEVEAFHKIMKKEMKN